MADRSTCQRSDAVPKHAAHNPTNLQDSPPPVARQHAQPLVLPALGQQDSAAPDLLLSFQRPDGSMSTPRADGLHAPKDLDNGPSTLPPRDSPSAATADDYFTADAVMSHSVNMPRRSSHDVDTPESRRSSKSTDATSYRADTSPTASIVPQSATTAPPSTSTSTQQATANPAEGRMQPRRSLTEYPQYPNQAHAALHSQIYPDPHRPARPGSAGMHPLQTATRPTMAPVERAPAWIDRRSANLVDADRPARTVGNTPISSPGTVFGVLAPRRSPSAASNADHSSPAPSPYLHPMQGHAPKETTRANRDVDTISGRKTINQYEIQHELGRGVHGKVKLARNLNTDEYVAIKIVQRHSRRRKFGKASNPEDKVKREIAILKKTNHPNVVSLIEVIDDPEMTKIYIVLEFCDNHEVQWRTPGSSEIVIMEHRRLEREQAGEDDDTEAALGSDHIMRAAQKRRERALRRKRKPLSRINSVSDFWSLEYAEESDDDDLHSQPSSSLPASQSQSQPSSAPLSRASSAQPHDQSMAESHVDDEDVPPDYIPDRAHAKPQYDYANQPGSNFDPEVHRQGLDLDQFNNHLNLSGFDRGRHHSVAESTVSRITEYMEEEIEEEHRYVPTMTLYESRAAFRDAVLGVEYLHYQGIVHRDIKPANLLRKADYRVKISDFGVSYLGKPIREGEDSAETSETEAETNEHEEDTELAKTVGTPAFYAPELCSLDFADDQQRRVTGQIDVWALGVTLYCLLYARTPFTGDNEFMVMRRIAEEEVFISKRRLKAVDSRASSRSNSHGPLFRETRAHRLPSELVYEAIDEDLMDLLKRLFIKDPTKRITLTEIKHHPWVLRDIARPQDWIEETTPHRQLHGKKIEISKEEVADAVIPLKVIERAKSMVRNVAGVFGFGSRAGRRRAQSNTSSDGGSGSATSAPHSESSSKGRRASERPAELGGSMTSLQSIASRAGEHHPLSQSVTASPEVTEQPRFFDETFAIGPSGEPVDSQTPQSRPTMPARADSSVSTAASIKTVRQSDFGRGRPAAPPSLPTPTIQRMPLAGLEHTAEPPQSIASVLGKASDNLVQDILSRGGSSDVSPRMASSLEPHGPKEQFFSTASTAVATASASGLVQSPPVRAKSNDSAIESALQSPVSSKGSYDIYGVSSSDATRATSPAATESPFASQRMSPVNLGGGMSYGAPNFTIRDNADDEEYHAALKRLHHRRQLEDEHEREAERRMRPRSAYGSPCPPSPDDEAPVRRQSQRSDEEGQGAFFLPLSAAMETRRPPNPSTSNPVSSGSSFDQLHSSGMSQSTSFPSAPSIASANTEYPNAGSNDYLPDDLPSTNSSDGTAQQTTRAKTPNSHQSSYRTDQATDEDGTDSDDSDADLVMMAPKRKGALSTLSRQTSHTSSVRSGAGNRLIKTTTGASNAS